MDNQSNSKYYHGDCVCKKKNVPTRIAIECEDCINDAPERYFNNRRGYTCSCIDMEINHAMCVTCASDRDEIDNLSDTLDEIMYNLSFNIKQYINCEEKLKEINIIAKRMRHLNRRLLERLIPTELGATSTAEPMETETNPETSTVEPMETETNPEKSTAELSEEVKRSLSSQYKDRAETEETEYEYEYEEEEDEEEFKCPSCKLVQSNNWCFKCDTENTCQNCVGHGGDDNTEGHEEWICQTCFDEQPEEEEEEEEEGIGCNNCYACVSGGSSPCILDLVSNQTDETDNEIETNEMMPKFVLAEDKTDWRVPLARNEVCRHNM